MTKSPLAKLTLSIALLFLMGLFVQAGGRLQRRPHIKVNGAVVARIFSAIGLAKLTSVPIEEILIVRVDGKGKLPKPRYIKVSYQHWHNEPSLPAEILQSDKRWRFALVRNSGCDSSLESLLNIKGKTESGAEVSAFELQRAKGAESEDIPKTLILPCYILHPSNLKPNGK